VPRFPLSSVTFVGLAGICLAASCASNPAADNAVSTGQSGGGAGTTAGGGGSGIGGASGSSSGLTGAGTTGAGTAGAVAAGGAVAGNGGAASGTGGSSAGSGGGGAGGSPTGSRTGMKSAGCGKPEVGDMETVFTNRRISIPACAPCTVPDCPKNCVAPPFVPGGVNAQMSTNGETLVDRDFTFELPALYDPNHPYPVFFGADGCGPQPPLRGAGFRVPGTDGAIKVGVQQIGACFADGGIRCAPDIKNVDACVNGPEIPYLLAVQDWVEANFCVDLGSEFIGGGSSGAWEALLAGCAAANTFRGTYSLAGGLREHRWACNGPMASFMIVSATDTGNPVGPLATLNVIEDTFGMAPARDEILKRNGCVGTDHAPYDPAYPSCVKYTGCPAAYPVVWCEFAGGSHDNPNFGGVNYINAITPFLLGLPPVP
jgi:polyhydroxybutyrate depolymerase